MQGHMSPAQFERQIRYLAQSGYKSLRVCDLAERWPMVLEDAPAVVLTFDDGLSNNRTIVCETLARYGMTGTFFVPTSCIGKERQCPSEPGMAPYLDTKMLCWSDLREMVAMGFEIGAHSHRHVMVARQSRDTAAEEIFQPKKILEDKLQTRVHSFAYPKGHSDSFAGWTRQMLKEAGYAAGCTMVGRALSKDDMLLELPRIGMRADDNMCDLKGKIAGQYECLRWFRTRV